MSCGAILHVCHGCLNVVPIYACQESGERHVYFCVPACAQIASDRPLAVKKKRCERCRTPLEEFHSVLCCNYECEKRVMNHENCAFCMPGGFRGRPARSSSVACSKACQDAIMARFENSDEDDPN